MKGLILALQFLTRLPLPRVQSDARDFAAAMRWFPAAGLVVGAAIAGPWLLLYERDPWLAALAGLIGWITMTGALHLDGLADVADGLGAAHGEPERLRAVMADPHVGSFSVVVLVLQLMAKLVLLHALPVAQAGALIALPALARIGPIAWTLFLPPLHEGLGTQFRSRVARPHLLCWALAAIVASVMLSPALLAVFVFVPLWGWWLRSRLGGISGDGHGAGIEIVETALLGALALWP